MSLFGAPSVQIQQREEYKKYEYVLQTALQRSMIEI